MITIVQENSVTRSIDYHLHDVGNSSLEGARFHLQTAAEWTKLQIDDLTRKYFAPDLRGVLSVIVETAQRARVVQVKGRGPHGKMNSCHAVLLLLYIVDRLDGNVPMYRTLAVRTLLNEMATFIRELKVLILTDVGFEITERQPHGKQFALVITDRRSLVPSTWLRSAQNITRNVFGTPFQFALQIQEIRVAEHSASGEE